MSWQAVLFNILLRIYRWFSRPGTVEQFRQRARNVDARRAQDSPIATLEPANTGPVPFYCINGKLADSPARLATQRIVLYCHGGGFVSRMLHSQSRMVIGWCEQFDAIGIIPLYRLAPEQPYPAAPDDCLAFYQWLLQQGAKASNIVLLGDSAGGCLALTTLQGALGRQQPAPACCVVISPATDLTMSGVSALGNARADPMFDLHTLLLLRNSYAKGPQLTHPQASPLFGNLHGLPPLAVHVGSTEIMLDDSLRLAELARAAGVEVELTVWPGMAHVFQLFDFLPETLRCRQMIAEFIRQHTGWIPVVANQKLVASCDSRV